MSERPSFQTRPIGPSRFVPGFSLYDADLPTGITMRYAMGGKGPALFLVHGHPHTHVIWRKVAPALANYFRVVMPDLRGYGDSSKPPSDAEHRAYSKRVMAADLIELAKGLGIERFDFVGHDRGARVGHRLALDWPEFVGKCVFIDIAPTATMYALTDKEFATRYFWWFFLIQPFPLPEKCIAADPAFFLQRHLDGQSKTPGSCAPEIFAEYLRCYCLPGTIHAICEDYRAAATIDLEDDAADAQKRIRAPLLLLWGSKGTVGKLYDVPKTWEDKALNVRGEALPCGHSVEEEVPELFLKRVLPFLAQ